MIKRSTTPRYLLNLVSGCKDKGNSKLHCELDMKVKLLDWLHNLVAPLVGILLRIVKNWNVICCILEVQNIFFLNVS